MGQDGLGHTQRPPAVHLVVPDGLIVLSDDPVVAKHEETLEGAGEPPVVGDGTSGVASP